MIPVLGQSDFVTPLYNETIVYLATRHHRVGHVLADVASGYLAEQQEAVFLVVPVHSKLPHQLKHESAKNEFKIELK